LIQQTILRQQNTPLELALAVLVSAVTGALFLVSPWLGLPFVLGIAVVALLLSNPKLIAYLMIPTIVLTSGMERGRLIPQLIPNEVILVFMVGLALPFLLMPKWQRTSTVKPVSSAIIILIVGTIIIPYIGYLLRDIPFGISAHLKLLAPLQYLLVFWLFRHLVTSDTDRYRLVKWMLAWGSLIGLIGVLQGFQIGPVIWLLDTLYNSPHLATAGLGRATSLLGAWNGLGVFMAVNLLIGRACLYSDHPEAPKKPFLTITMGLCAAGLLVSGSYAGLGGVLLGFLLIGHLEKRLTKSILLFIGLGLLALPLLPHLIARFDYQYRGGNSILPQTFVFRLQVWHDVFWPLVKEYWLLGYRPVLPSNLSWQYAESQYLGLIIQAGVVALAAHLAWIGILMKWLYGQVRAANPLQRSLSTALFVIFLVMLLMSFTNSIFTYSGVIEYIWILIGLIAGIYGEEHVTRPT
jgi:predicted membrane channel-forming protein YqfA (hemolysin III family)